MLKDAFLEAVSRYTQPRAGEALWREIEEHYAQPHRQYHTLQHLENMMVELNGVKHLLQHSDATLFAIAYHDIIYNPLSKKNEAKSAALARRRLNTIGFPDAETAQCVELIMATQRHLPNASTDINLFTDADLSVLGAGWSVYEAYAAAIRKEYSVYPDLLYKPGRRKVLQHFLDLPKIFKTAPFYDRYEQQARHNILREQSQL